MNIKAILFDKDGTLIDFERTFAPALAAVIKELSDDDVGVANALAQSVEFELDTLNFNLDSIVIAGTNHDVATQFSLCLPNINIDKLAFELDGMFERHSAKSVVALDGMLDTLNILNGLGIPLGIATNDTEENARLHMEALNATSQFQFFAGYDSGHGSKPAPGSILAFAEQFDIKPSEIAMVGDSVHDLKTALNAGAYGVGVLTGLADKATLAPHADIVLEDINQLPELIVQQSQDKP